MKRHCTKSVGSLEQTNQGSNSSQSIPLLYVNRRKNVEQHALPTLAPLPSMLYSLAAQQHFWKLQSTVNILLYILSLRSGNKVSALLAILTPSMSSRQG